MPLPLKESRAARDLAELLYSFLPGSGNEKWSGHISFKTVAAKVGVGEFWQPGSKTPMIACLLERTLEFRRGKFEPLILEIVRSGLTYRQKNGRPVTPDEIEKINGLILEVGFKFPDLWDPAFASSLRLDGASRASEKVKRVRAEEQLKEAARDKRSLALEELKAEFTTLHLDLDRQAAGLRLEVILNRLFSLYDLDPREPFRVVGEQIDGSFVLDHEVYLVEAKWLSSRAVNASDLSVFRDKVTGKSNITRGVFISINGYTSEAVDAITRGKQPSFLVMDGYDLMMLLEERLDLVTYLRRRVRFFGEGRIQVQFPEVIARAD
jgi:hypothetical protein